MWHRRWPIPGLPITTIQIFQFGFFLGWVSRGLKMEHWLAQERESQRKQAAARHQLCIRLIHKNIPLISHHGIQAGVKSLGNHSRHCPYLALAKFSKVIVWYLLQSYDCWHLLSDEELYCRSVWSSLSGSTRRALAVAHCNSNEEMFSCSSFSKNGKWRGEHIEVRSVVVLLLILFYIEAGCLSSQESWTFGAALVVLTAVLPHSQDQGGRKECVAHNGFGGQGVYAVARCCIWPKADCQVNTQSQSIEGTPMQSVACLKDSHVLTGMWSVLGWWSRCYACRGIFTGIMFWNWIALACLARRSAHRRCLSDQNRAVLICGVTSSCPWHGCPAPMCHPATPPHAQNFSI